MSKPAQEQAVTSATAPSHTTANGVERSSSSWSWQTIAAISVCIFAVPICIDLALGGTRHLFDYLTSDSYYYFVVGRNLASGHGASFDGTMPTNGFHPLWQLVNIIAFLAGRVLQLKPMSTVVLLLLASVAAISGALVLFAKVVARARGRVSAALAFAPIGVYGALVYPVWLREVHNPSLPPVYGTLWSYVNGMETPMAIIAYAGLIAWYCCKRWEDSWASAATLGVLMATLALARLDTVFISAALGGLMLLETLGQKRMRNGRKALAACGIFAAIIIGYCLVNLAYAHSPMPISGSLKTTFPHIHVPNITRLWNSTLHPTEQTLYRMYRLTQLVLPGLASLAYLVIQIARSFRQRRLTLLQDEPIVRAFAATAVGVLAVSVYDLCYVELAAQGPWYNPIGTTFMTLWLVDWLSRREPLFVKSTFMRVGALLLGILGTSCFFVREARGLESHRAWADFYLDDAPAVVAFYGNQVPKFLEVDDGIFTFATGYPAMAGKGLALDFAAANALKRGDLIPIAVSRGFNRVTSIMYMDARGLGPDTSSARACELISGVTPPKLCSQYRFSIEYARAGFAIVRVDPK